MNNWQLEIDRSKYKFDRNSKGGEGKRRGDEKGICVRFM